MTKRQLTAVSRTQGNNRALKDGAITLPDFDLAFEEVNPLPKAFRRMVRESAYDVCEMALTTYITAKAYGAKLTAIPVFLVRGFHHGAIVAGQNSAIRTPKDFEGRRIGVKRGFTVTTGVWARAILAEEHGVDLSRINWERSDVEHIENWRLPPNVRDLADGVSLEEQLANGNLDAAVGLTADDTTRSLIEDPFQAGINALASRGFYPINHLVVIRDDLLADVPDLSAQLFDAFAKSKMIYMNDLKTGRIAEPTALDRVHLAALDHMDDPLPYGVAPNHWVLESLMQHVVSQGIIDTPLSIDDLFAPSTLEKVS